MIFKELQHFAKKNPELYQVLITGFIFLFIVLAMVGDLVIKGESSDMYPFAGFALLILFVYSTFRYFMRKK